MPSLRMPPTTGNTSCRIPQLCLRRSVGSARNNNDKKKDLSTSLPHPCSFPLPARSSPLAAPPPPARVPSPPPAPLPSCPAVACPRRRACGHDDSDARSSASPFCLSPYVRFHCRSSPAAAVSPSARRRLVLAAFARSHAWICSCFCSP